MSAVGAGGGEAVLDLDVRQQGQALVSALWGLVGVVALVVGLSRNVREVRIGALLLLLATAGKVFCFDLAALTSIYRVISFVALGLLLLAGSFAYQRLRPRSTEARRLFDRNGLRQVARLVHVQAARRGDVVREKLERDDGEDRLQQPVGARHEDHLVAPLVDA